MRQILAHYTNYSYTHLYYTNDSESLNGSTERTTHWRRAPLAKYFASVQFDMKYSVELLLIESRVAAKSHSVTDKLRSAQEACNN